MIAGTSVGALNMVLLLNNNPNIWTYIWRCEIEDNILYFNERSFKENFKQISNIFTHHTSKYLNPFANKLNKKDIYSNKLIDLKVGIFSRDGLKSIIDNYIDLNNIKKSKKSLYVCATKIPNKEATYFNLKDCKSHDEVCKILLASSAIPGVFKHETINKFNFIDGGLSNNLPIKPLIDEGCDLIITSPLHGLKGSTEDFRVNKQEWKNTTFIELIPEKSMGGHLGVLDFSRANARVLMSDGYSEQKDIIEAISKLVNK